MDMKEQRFGIEIEMTGLSRQRAADVLSNYFGRPVNYSSGHDVYSVLDDKNRRWKVVSDGSIAPERREGRQVIQADRTYRVELVSPICRYEDIQTIQELVRRLRGAGMRVNKSCGIHIHLDALPHNASTLRNITNIMASKEDLIYKAMQVEVARERQYCRKVEQSFLEELNRKKPRTLDEVSRIWYQGNDGRREHYHDSRYHCLNLHSVFQKGTIEFRLFNSTTHAGKIKAYIQLCLAISAQALNQRCASRQKTRSTNEKYTFRTWLLRLGLIGDEFKTARLHLLEHLDGCIAWKDPAQAEQQKQRLKERKERELAEAAQTTAAQQEQATENAQDLAGVVDESPGFSLSM
ncbi:putative amidoligase enzyme [Desulfitobacterium sp. LBE]|uniref:Amidoligase enzyme n=1 Tax=bioreactor metagenome TaxID=1076179 RepID=A0A644WCD7_9ZZZZ|nr:MULTISPECIES: amidoligase family protein [Desulfitobacterium]MEA5026008.1 amidoligase family protein [Desulfitobacterium hafniense]TWH59567.1 putative amidoligase enzyme [Desulfitobacterium sp. LBE]